MENNHVTIDDLAGMIKEGFEKDVKQGFEKVEKDMKQGFEKVEKDIDDLKQGQERIELRLDNVAYRFELVALEKRVEALEKVAKA